MLVIAGNSLFLAASIISLSPIGRACPNESTRPTMYLTATCFPKCGVFLGPSFGLQCFGCGVVSFACLNVFLACFAYRWDILMFYCAPLLYMVRGIVRRARCISCVPTAMSNNFDYSFRYLAHSRLRAILRRISVYISRLYIINRRRCRCRRRLY